MRATGRRAHGSATRAWTWTAVMALSLLAAPARGAVSVNMDPGAPGAEWEGIGAEMRPFIEGSGVDYLGLTPDEMFSKLRNELGIRYARTVIRIDQQSYNNGQWNWNQPPADPDQFGNVSVWEVLATMQDYGIEPVVTPFFWPAGIVADSAFVPGQPRNINFIGDAVAYLAVENWFAQLVQQKPAGFDPKLFSIQNEPDSDAHLYFDLSQFTIVTQNVINRLEQQNANVEFIVADTAKTGTALSYAPAQFDTGQTDWFRAIGYHTYGTVNRPAMESGLVGYGLPFWMTEQAYNGTGLLPTSWDFAEVVGEDFYRDMTEVGVTAWFLWYVGGSGNRMYNGTDWNPYAAMIGLIGRHVPPGARQVFAQNTGDVRILGWTTNNNIYVWVLNSSSGSETVIMQAPNLSGGQAWRVSQNERFVNAGTGQDVVCPGNSATLFIGSLQTAPPVPGPAVEDIPDLRVTTGQSAQDVLSLDDYVSDFDYVNYEANQFNVLWNAAEIDPAPGVALDVGDKVQVDPAPSPVDSGEFLFTAENPAGATGADTSHFKSSSFRVTDPWLLPDPRLDPRPGNARFATVLDPDTQASALTVAEGVLDVSGSGPFQWPGATINQVYDPMNQFDADHLTLVDGNPATLDRRLQVSVNTSGRFTLEAGDLLEGPYLVGIPAVKSATDWDGGTLLVSGSILSSSSLYSDAAPDYARDERFEGITGELTRVGFKRYDPQLPNRLPGEALCSWEHAVSQAANAGVGYGSATVVLNSDLPVSLQASGASFPGDHSGNALRVRVWPDRPIVFLNRVRTLPAGVTEAGETGVLEAGVPYAVEASVASNAPDDEHAPVVRVALATQAFTENSISALAGSRLPQEGEGWMALRTLLEPSADALYNDPPGIRPVMVVAANPQATGPVDVYIDNVTVYRSAFDTDLARGSTRIPMVGDPALAFPGPVRGDFEEATGELRGPGYTGGGNANSFYLSQLGPYAEAPPGTYVGVLPGDTSTVRKSGDTNWFEAVFFPTADLPLILSYRTPPMVAEDGSALPDGIYELHADYVTPSGADSFVDLNIALADQDFQSWTRYELRPVAGDAGTQGTVRKVRLTAALRGVSSVVALLIPAQTMPVSVESAAYLDNVELHLIRERSEYWDRSLFEPAD